MIIKIKLSSLNNISLSTFTCSKSTTETRKELHQRRHSDVSFVNTTVNLEQVIIRRYISLKFLKQLTVLRHSMLVKTG